MTITGQVGLIEQSMEHTTEEQHKRLRAIAKAVQRMVDLLDAYKKLVSVSQQPLQAATIDITRMAEEIARQFAEEHRERSVSVTVHPELVAYSDPVLLESVLTNLLDNAFKFTSRTPSPVVEVGRCCLKGRGRAGNRSDRARGGRSWAECLDAATRASRRSR